MNLLSSSYGAAYASLLATQKETNLHHSEGLLTCEGKCSEHAVTPTHHRMLHELKSVDSLGNGQFKQVYECTVCKTPRQFGLTEERATSRGESN